MVKKSKMFSIITVCYNEEKNIEKTCKSVVSQSFKDFEWIVIDGGSNDKTASILKKYKRDMSYFVSEKDNGVYSAMNKGTRKAGGNYLLFLNGGDFLLNKETLAQVSEFIKKDKLFADIYYGDLEYDNGEVVIYKNSHLDRKFFTNKSISHQATFIRKELFGKFGLYNEEYKIVADFDFWIRTIIKNKIKIKYLPIVISIFDQAGMSTNPKFTNRQILERNSVLLKYGMITNKQAELLKIKWRILSALKRAGVYSILRKVYRRFIRR